MASVVAFLYEVNSSSPSGSLGFVLRIAPWPSDSAEVPKRLIADTLAMTAKPQSRLNGASRNEVIGTEYLTEATAF